MFTIPSILYILFLALTQSLLVQVLLLVMLYIFQYLRDNPSKNWYGYDDHKNNNKENN